jgi:hypothetical protein
MSASWRPSMDRDEGAVVFQTGGMARDRNSQRMRFVPYVINRIITRHP